MNRTALFEIPIWTSDLPAVVPYHQEMSDEVEQMIDAPGPKPPSFLAHQTPDDPFGLPSPGWRLLEEETNAVYRELAQTNFQRWRAGEFHLRRWAIRLGRLDALEKDRLGRDGKHNHLPALFSSIYYLRVPPELRDKEAGGTRFWNPIGNLMDVMGPRESIVPPREGRLIVFPAFVDHAPIPVEWDAGDVPRIVVACDVFYVSGRARSAHDVQLAARGSADNGPEDGRASA